MKIAGIIIYLTLFFLTSCRSYPSYEEQDSTDVSYDDLNLINQKLDFLTDENQIIWAKRVIAIGNKLLITRTPLKWSINPAFERLNSKEYLAKYVPEDQDLDNWQKLMVIKVVKNTNISPNSYLNDEILKNQLICQDEKFNLSVYDQFDDYILAEINCASKKKNFGQFFSFKKELITTIYQIHKIGNNIYIISFSWQNSALIGKNIDKATDNKQIDDFIKNISESFVCSKDSIAKECLEYRGLFN